jgi:hypothetical protein
MCHVRIPANSGGFMVFLTIEDVGAWADKNGGEAVLREGLAVGRFGADRRALELVETWLKLKDYEYVEEALAAHIITLPAEHPHSLPNAVNLAQINTYMGSDSINRYYAAPCLFGLPFGNGTALRSVSLPQFFSDSRCISLILQ